MRIKLLLLNLSAFIFSLTVQGQVVYTLNECIKTSLENNFSLLITRNSEEISRNNFAPGNAGFLPSIDLNGRHSGTLNSSTTNYSDGTQGSTSGVFNTASSAGVSLGLTIFNGFNVQTTYKKLNELKQLGELNTQMAVENLVSGIVSAYNNYINQVQLLNNLKYALTLSKERLRIDEERYLLGSSSKLNVLQSMVYVNSDSTRLSRQAETVKATQIQLNELMALEDLGRTFVSQDTSIEISNSLLYEKLIEETLLRNTSLLVAGANKTISEFDRKLIASRSYPYLNLSSGYSYSYNTYSSSSTRNQLTDGMNYGLTMGLNIFDGFNQRRNLQNSELELMNKELRFQEVEQGVKADLLTIYSAYSNYLRLVALEEQNLSTATENLAIAMERYRLGNLSGLDLREVQMSLLEARESLLSVKYQAKLAEISLLLISGRIMEYYQ
ncbi:MAG: TolC family protein [Bacteroidota bacterium]